MIIILLYVSSLDDENERQNSRHKFSFLYPSPRKKEKSYNIYITSSDYSLGGEHTKEL